MLSACEQMAARYLDGRGSLGLCLDIVHVAAQAMAQRELMERLCTGETELVAAMARLEALLEVARVSWPFVPFRGADEDAWRTPGLALARLVSAAALHARGDGDATRLGMACSGALYAVRHVARIWPAEFSRASAQVLAEMGG